MKYNTGLKRVKANDSDQYQFSLNENRQATIADLLKIKSKCKNQISVFNWLILIWNNRIHLNNICQNLFKLLLEHLTH